MPLLLPLAQQRSISLAPKPTAALSLLCGAVVAIFILVSKERRAHAYHRIILIISFHIILHSTAICIGSAAIPTHVKPSVYGAAGNITTCNAQGFVAFTTRFSQILYYCSLPFVVLWSQQRSKVTSAIGYVRWGECWIHLVCNIIPLIFSIIALHRQYLNPVQAGIFCELNEYPSGCIRQNNCIRGDRGVEIMFRASASLRFIVAGIALLILSRIHRNAVESIAFWAVLTPILTQLAIGIALFYVIAYNHGPEFSYNLTMAVMILWPSVGIVHLVSYFSLGRNLSIIHSSQQTSKHPSINDTESSSAVFPVGMDIEMNFELQWSNLEKVAFLASGSNCWIYSALFNNRPTVIKLLKPEFQSCRVATNEMEDELEIFRHLNHPNICSLYGAGHTSQLSRFIVLERLDGGTLSQKFGYRTKHTRNNRRIRSNIRISKFTYEQVLNYARDIAAAMAYCHHNQAIANGMLLHRDLKPDNIGFTADDTLKIFDFGLSRVIYDASPDDIGGFYDMSECGSWRYMAPEIADSKPYNQKVDVYSFAIILWEMMMFQKPFDGMTKEEIYEKIVLDGERPPIDKRWPYDFVQLMTLCWSPDPVDRPSFIDIGKSLDKMLMKGQRNYKKEGKTLKMDVTDASRI